MTEARPVLYSFRRCPYAMRGRMALDAAQIKVEHREILLKDKPAEMLEASPKGTVPVVVLPDGQVIEESLDVMHWALAQNDPENWWPDDAEHTADIEALIARNDGDFKHHLDRYKYATRYEGAVSEDHRAAAAQIIDQLEARLTTSPQLFGDAPTPGRFRDLPVHPPVRQHGSGLV
jgi:glutathione S-transferase